MAKRIFVFEEDQESMKAAKRTRPILYAIPEEKIELFVSQSGSENAYLEVNGKRVNGSFERIIDQIGVRVDVKKL